MRKLRLNGSAWLAFGLVAGLLLAPAAAVAAANLVGIIGSNGKRAQVTAANQLQTAAATPGQVRAYRVLAIADTCKIAVRAPANKSLVLTRASLNVYQNTTPGLANWVGLFRDAGCNQQIVIHNAPDLGVLNVPFDPGYGIRAGQSIYTRTLGNVRGEAYLHGYLVPKGAVPATTPTTLPPAPARGTANPNG